MSDAYDSLLSANARDTGLPFAVLKAMVATESNFNPNAVRVEAAINDKSIGLMQILLSTARGIVPGITEAQLSVPANNIMIGSRYLAQQVSRYGGDIWKGVAAYNYGSAKVAITPTTVCLARDNTGKCIRSFTAQAGQFYNQPYVDKVRALADGYGFDDVTSGSSSAGIDGAAPPLAVVGIVLVLVAAFLFARRQ